MKHAVKTYRSIILKLPINTGVHEVHRATILKTDVGGDSQVVKKVPAVAFAKHRGMDHMEVQALCSQKSSYTAFHFVCVCVCLSERVFALLCLHILFLCIFKGLKLHANQFEPTIDQEWG